MSLDSLTDTRQMVPEASIRGASMIAWRLLQRVEVEVAAEALERFQDGAKSLEAVVVAWRDFHQRAHDPLLMATRIIKVKSHSSPNINRTLPVE